MIKIDFEKAYDVDWDFFKLSEFGFPSCFINLIMSGITSTLDLKWNN
jgi:hypothetical protein